MTIDADFVPTDWTAPADRPRQQSPVTGRTPIDPAEARELLSDELYMARVWSLIRREEETRTGQTAPTSTPAAAPVSSVFTGSTTPAPQQSPARAGVPGWVWQYSALALSSGGFIALAGYGIGAAAPGLAAVDDILAALGQAVMSIAVLAVLAALFLAGRRTHRGTGPTGTTVNIRKAVIKRSHFHG
ncbi:hypothetical protein [Streptomyces sp. NBC_00439]|uniref:hypothetical protein n=1 Tax=Streptomyces sp. NBC_00439 TaxID=2903650 RepID=UPI0022592344|nr:hypothetical protein [Streptomyces sp. NBC_00439]MCX5100250.1 hypothetical protein [Streptomyces sp. NBC_00439]